MKTKGKVRVMIWSFMVVVMVVSALVCSSAPKKWKVGVSLPAADIPFYVNVEYGIKEAAKEIGSDKIEVKILFAGEDPVKQMRDLEDFVQSGVDILLVSPVDAVGSVGPIEQAVRAGVPVITLGRRSESKATLFWVGQDDYEIGVRIAEYIVKRLGRKGGKVALLRGPEGTTYPQYQEEGVMSVFKKNPQIKVVTRLSGRDTIESGLQLMQDVLQAHPDVDAVYCCADEIALGAINAAKAAGIKGIIFAGGGGEKPGMTAIEKGEYDYTCMKQPGMIGYLGLKKAYEYLENFPKMTYTPLIDVTKENVHKVDRKWNQF